MENDCISSLFDGFNTPSPVTKQRRLVDNQANATTESLLHSSPPKTDEDVAIYDALERPRSRTRLSPKSPGSGIGNLIGASGSSSSPASGGSSRRTPMNVLNPRAREYKPKRFSHSEQELRSGISNFSRTEIRRLSGGSSGALILPPSPTIYPSFVLSPIPCSLSPLPSLPSNNFYFPCFENSPRTPIPMAPPQPPFLVRPTSETTPHRPTTTTSSAKSKSPVTLNLPSEQVKTKPSLDESTIDATMDLPSASISIQSQFYSDWVPLDDGIECTLPTGFTRNETRTSSLHSAGSSPDGTPDSTLPSAGSTKNGTLSTLTSGSTQNDCNLASGSTDQSQTFSREELDDYMNIVLYEVRRRKRHPAFENITNTESNE